MSYSTDKTECFTLEKITDLGKYYISKNRTNELIIVENNKAIIGTSRKPPYMLKQHYPNGGIVYVSGLFPLGKSRCFSGDFYNKKEMVKTRFKLELSENLDSFIIKPFSIY